MNELCLFTGAGGGLLATKYLLGFRTVCYVEWDAYCQKVLQARIKDGFLDDAPIWDDAQTFDGRPWCGCVDIVTAGFPCQPFSGAGKQAGESDKRNMWPETIRIIREVGPRFCLLENVPRLLKFDYFGTILGDLAEAGFDARWKVVSAAECGAPHIRKRLWIVAYPNDIRQCESGLGTPERMSGKYGSGRSGEGVFGRTGRDDQVEGTAKKNVPKLAHATGYEYRGKYRELGKAKGAARQKRHQFTEESGSRSQEISDTTIELCTDIGVCRNVQFAKWWDKDPADVTYPDSKSIGRGRKGTTENDSRHVPGVEGNLPRNLWTNAEPRLGRVADGVADRVDRLGAIGNGQVPAVAARAWLELNPFDNEI